MDIPEQYFPIRVCPHIGEGEHHRLLFAECGCYENVNIRFRDKGKRSIFLPQKGQGSVKNLTRNIPSLPLFNHPLYDKWKEWDLILGMKNYNEMQSDLASLIYRIKLNRGAFKNYPKTEFLKRLHSCSKIIHECYQNGQHDLTQLPAEQYSEIKKTLNQIYVNYDKATDTCAYGTSCLNGYNRDFYGGLLSLVTTNSRKSSDVLIHAGGTSFQDIFITETSCKPNRRLRQARLLDKLSLDEPVYQIISSSMCTDEGLLCARQKQKCLLICSKDHKLVQKGVMHIPDELLTSVSFSPYMNNELLVSTQTGSVYLWNISTNSKNRLLVKTPPDSSSRERWSCSYFGGHPQHIMVADTTSVAMFDHRSRFTESVDLFSLSPSLTKKDELIMAATSLGFPFHAVVTDYAVFIIDQRFALAPVLSWSTEFLLRPQYIQVLHQQNSPTEQEKILFVASQQPAEVMCFPLTTHSGHSPTSPVIPWRLSQIGDFCQSTHTSYMCDLMKTERRFQASLAGIAVSNQSAENSFTVYQVDCYGEIFYQTLVHKPEDLYDLQSCTEEERQAADELAGSWLRAFENSAKHETLQLKCVSVQLAPSIFNDIFSQASSSKTQKEHIPYCPPPLKYLHKRLTRLDKLPSNGSSAQLHLALREKTDIMEFVQEREKDHTAMKMKLRELNLKVLEERKRLTKKPEKCKKRRKKFISNYRCDITDDDDDVGRGETENKDNNGSIKIEDGCDQTVVEMKEDPDTIGGSSSNSSPESAQSEAGYSS